MLFSKFVIFFANPYFTKISQAKEKAKKIRGKNEKKKKKLERKKKFVGIYEDSR